MRRLFLFVILLIVSWVPDAHAGIIFSDGMNYASVEAARAAGWNYECNNGSTAPLWTNCSTDFVSSPVVSGTGALRQTIRGVCVENATSFGVVQGCHPGWNSSISRYHTPLTNMYTRIWIRYQRIDSSIALVHSNNSFASEKILYHNCCGVDPISPFDGFFNYDTCWGGPCTGIQRNFNVVCPSGNSSPSCTYPQNDQSLTMPTDVWVCWETHHKMNDPGSSNGVYEQWVTINGVEKRTHNYASLVYRNAATASSTFRHLKIFMQYGQNFYRYIDDLAISDTRIGCGAAPSDSTPPAVPSTPSITTGTALPVGLTWPPVTDSDLANYLVYRKLNEACSGGASLSLLTTLGITTSFTDSTVPQGTTHVCYKLASQDTTGNVSALSTGVDQDIATASLKSKVKTWVTDTLGGDITFDGAAYKFRYWSAANSGAKTEMSGLGGVTSYRLNIAWTLANGGFVCVEAAGQDGVYETVADPNSYICNGAPVTVTTSLLKVHPTNGRWLADINNKAVMLAGSGFNGCCTPLNLSRSALQDGFTEPVLTTSMTDDFARTDANPVSANPNGSTYAAASGNQVMAIVSGTLRGTTANAVNSAISSLVVPSDHASEIEVTGDAGTWQRSLRLKVRVNGASDDGYECLFSTDKSTFFELKISRRTSGSLVDLKTGTYSHGTGRYAARAVGTIIQCLKDDVVLMGYDTANDSTKYTSGKAGVGLFAATGATFSQFTLDNFKVSAVTTTNDFSAQLTQQVANGSKISRWMINERSAWGAGTAFATYSHSRVPLDQMAYCVSSTRTDTSTGVPVVVGVYDLNCFNQTFFDRLRSRVLEAVNAGMVPAINLFTGWQMSQAEYESFSNPFGKSSNNIQGIGMDTNNNGKTEEAHTLVNSAVNIIQRNYVSKVVTAVCDIGPVIIEVSNEDMGLSGSDYTDIKNWQNMIAQHVRDAEASLGCVSHILFRSFYGQPFGYFTDFSNLFSDTDTIGDMIAPGPPIPAGANYVTNPPANDGATKVVAVDMDHQGLTTPMDWEWKVFTRAGYPIYLDESWFDDDATRAAHRIRLKGVNEWGAKLKDLASMVPETGTSVFSTGYGLLNACQEYLGYRGSEGTLSINLSACSGHSFVVEAFNPATNTTYSAGTVSGGGTENFNPTEWSGDFVIYLLNDSHSDSTPPAKVQGVTIK